MESECLPKLSKEFIEENLGQKIESFEIERGTNIGDNYLSIMYSIDVKLVNGETIHLLFKCFPTHPARQEFLKKSNIFFNELSVYKVFIPALEKLLSNNGLGTKLPFPPLVGGNAADFLKMREAGDLSYVDKIYKPFDHFIIMTDLRKTWGFRMADRQTGLDVDHLRLVIKAHAKLHSLSWAYKQLHGLKSLGEKHSFFIGEMSQDDKMMWLSLLKSNLNIAIKEIECVMGSDSPLVSGTRRLIDNGELVIDVSLKQNTSEQQFSEFHRIQLSEPNQEDPWRVLLHGDCWTNNLMFRYDEDNKTPLEVNLVDLQIMRESCPSLELSYLIYSSTTTELRREHLDDILNLYYQEFTSNCNKLGVESLSNFTFVELKRRFHRAKIYGYFLAAMALPIVLNDAKNITDPDNVEGKNIGDMFENMCKPSSVYTKWIVSLAQELHDDGVL